MNQYVATFFSHYGALSYCGTLRERGIAARPSPVPRALSASCGTCVRYGHTAPLDRDDCELDGVFIEAGDGFDCMLRK